MTSTASPRPPGPDPTGPPADRVVFLCILLLLLAGDMLAPAPVSAALLARMAHPGPYLPTAAIAGLVGFAELVSRYRDAPWRVAIMPPGLIFIALNAGAGVFALFLFDTFPTELHAPANPVMRVLLAGTGAMVAVRTKIFTIRQPSGSDVAVGPAFVLDTLLSAVNREVDRRRAQIRMRSVAACAAGLAAYQYAEAYDFLITSLASFQSLDAEVSRNLRSSLEQLKNDAALGAMTEEAKFLAAGYSILTEFGDRAFAVVFSSLADYLGRPHPRRK